MRNNKGFSLFVAVLMVAAVSVVIATIAFSRSLFLSKIGKTYRHQVDSYQISHELAVVFANPKLCESLITVQGNRFKVAGVFESSGSDGTMIPLKGNRAIGIKKMSVENVTSVSGGQQSATFTIVTQEMHDAKGTTQRKNSIAAIFTPDSGGSGSIKNCRIMISPQTACADLGFKWNETSSRCEICEKMGGTWKSTACSLVSSAGRESKRQ